MSIGLFLRFFSVSGKHFRAPGNRIPAIADIEFSVQAFQVRLDGLGRNKQPCGDFLVAQVLSQQFKNVIFTIGQRGAGFHRLRAMARYGLKKTVQRFSLS